MTARSPVLRGTLIIAVLSGTLIVGLAIGYWREERVDPVLGTDITPLDLPSGLGAAHVHLSPDGTFVAVADPDLSRLRVYELSLRRGALRTIERASIAGPISGVRWDGGALLVRSASSPSAQVEDLHLLRPGGVLTVARGIPKGSPAAVAVSGDRVAVLAECCPAELRIYDRASFSVAARAASRMFLIGWNAVDELVYVSGGALHFWTPSGTVSTALDAEMGGVGVLGWAPSRTAAILGTRGTSVDYHVLVGHEIKRVTGVSLTGLFFRGEAVALDDTTLLGVDVHTLAPRKIADLPAVPRTLWGTSERHVFWSGPSGDELRMLDPQSGTERRHAFGSPIVAVLSSGSGRYIVLLAAGPPLLGVAA